MAHLNADEQLDLEAEVTSLRAERVAMIFDHAQEVSQLREGLISRKIIGEAIGLLMREYKLTEDAAFALLGRRSSYANVKVRDIAWKMVDEANSAGRILRPVADC